MATTTHYALDYGTNFINPERGFMMQKGMGEDYSTGVLQNLKNQGVSLIWFTPVIDAFVSTPLSAGFLTAFQTILNQIRSAGMKVILRFRYTLTAPTDAPLSIILGHMDQLQPYLASNSDIVLIMQCGWVGQWGEFNQSNNFGNGYDPSTLSAQNIADRKTVIQKCLSVMPPNRFVQVRQPWQKIQMFSSTPAQAGDAWSGNNVSRIGHYNDCFLEGASNGGTYLNISTEKDYCSADTLYVPFAAETCALVTGYTECTPALADFAKLRVTSLSFDYNQSVLNGFTTGGCMPQIQQRLGYRLGLDTFTSPDNIVPGGNATFAFGMFSLGFAPAYFRTKCNIILRSGSTVVRLPMAAQPRDWKPDLVTPIAISENLAIPANLPQGNYEVLIEIPDGSPSLEGNPTFSIRLANTDATAWEPTTGFNRTGLSVTTSTTTNFHNKSQASMLF
jgi:hypothetical protein